MHALSGPKGGYHLAGGWVDEGVPVYYYGWDRLVAVSHRPDESGCVGVRPDVDMVDREMMPAQDKSQPHAEHAARSPIQRDLRTDARGLGGTVHGNQSTTVVTDSVA
jgi:hypothetical protein